MSIYPKCGKSRDIVKDYIRELIDSETFFREMIDLEQDEDYDDDRFDPDFWYCEPYVCDNSGNEELEK